MKTRTVSTRLDEEELMRLDEAASRYGLDRSGMTKSLLRRGLAEIRWEQAVEAYRAEEVTLSRAAEMAGISLWDFTARMGSVGLSLNFGVGELTEDLNARL